ncbi:hypothetical protein IRZ70_21355 [Pseudomonas monteilii]|nr:hypothetical protein [Pseudomonas monteilii]
MKHWHYLGVLLTLCLSSTAVLAKDMTVTISTVINNKVGEDQCMDLASDKTKVIFNRCDTSPTQQWVMQKLRCFQHPQEQHPAR